MKKSLIIFTAVLTIAFMSAVPVLAELPCQLPCGDGGDECCDPVDTVTITNEADIDIEIEVEAETGENYADGSYGGDGDDGGDVEIEGCCDEEPGLPPFPCFGTSFFPWMGGDDSSASGNTGGDGGDGGDAGNGGTVVTGDATAVLTIDTDINTTRVLVDRCACEDEGCDEPCGGLDSFFPFPWFGNDHECDDECGESHVTVANDADLDIGGEVEAETGENDADGSYAGDGDDGGEVEIEDVDGAADNNTGGDGGDGGDAGDGGLVSTGDATSLVDIIKKINETIVRMLR
jgi:hypothetical protein